MNKRSRAAAPNGILPYHNAAPLSEKLLQYVWQFQCFNPADLRTEKGETVQVVHPGTWNHHQGPDFLNAQVRIDGTLLAGSVELHLRPSQWKQHGHDLDPGYRNVILHVVWEGRDSCPESIPLLVIGGRVPLAFLQRYNELMLQPASIPCAGRMGGVGELVWIAWKERLLIERLNRKAALVLERAESRKGHWEAVFWTSLFRSFGAKVNADAFEALGEALPLRLLLKHRSQIHQLEALLLGMAGFLEAGLQEEYARLLQREFSFLRKKYGLRPVEQPFHFLRMRPQNFPTVRLAQLAMLLHTIPDLFGKMQQAPLEEVAAALVVHPNDYWLTHYRLDEERARKEKPLGRDMVENILVNTVSPFLYAYGAYHRNRILQEKTLDWLAALPAEDNAIIRQFRILGASCSSSAETQALLELKTQYCNTRRCLDCAIGSAILGK